MWLGHVLFASACGCQQIFWMSTPLMITTMTSYRISPKASHSHESLMDRCCQQSNQPSPKQPSTQPAAMIHATDPISWKHTGTHTSKHQNQQPSQVPMILLKNCHKMGPAYGCPYKNHKLGIVKGSIPGWYIWERDLSSSQLHSWKSGLALCLRQWTGGSPKNLAIEPTTTAHWWCCYWWLMVVKGGNGSQQQ